MSVDVPGARAVTAHLTGSGTALRLSVSDPYVFAGRGDSAVVRQLAGVLAERGLRCRTYFSHLPRNKVECGDER